MPRSLSFDMQRPMSAGTDKAAKKLLKAQNQIYLWGFILLNAAAMIWAYLGLELDVTQLISAGGKKSGAPVLAGLASPVVVAVLNAVLSSQQKAKLIFWRWRDALPGHRAFTELGPQDPRVDMKALAARIGTPPETPREQNLAWYALLKKHEPASVLIAEYHRLFLLMRDLATIAFLFFLCAIVALPVATTPSIALSYAAVCAGVYLLLRLSAVHQGEALVTNVLAAEATGNSSTPLRPARTTANAVPDRGESSGKQRSGRGRRSPPSQ